MKTTDFIQHNKNLCQPGVTFLQTHSTVEEAWLACNEPSWLLLLVGMINSDIKESEAVGVCFKWLEEHGKKAPSKADLMRFCNGDPNRKSLADHIRKTLNPFEAAKNAGREPRLIYPIPSNPAPRRVHPMPPNNPPEATYVRTTGVGQPP